MAGFWQSEVKAWAWRGLLVKQKKETVQVGMVLSGIHLYAAGLMPGLFYQT
jgi:hypothetical protein